MLGAPTVFGDLNDVAACFFGGDELYFLYTPFLVACSIASNHVLYLSIYTHTYTGCYSRRDTVHLWHRAERS